MLIASTDVTTAISPTDVNNALTHSIRPTPQELPVSCVISRTANSVQLLTNVQLARMDIKLKFSLMVQPSVLKSHFVTLPTVLTVLLPITSVLHAQLTSLLDLELASEDQSSVM